MRRLKHALLNVQRNRRRSVMSVLIIAIAVLALVSAGGFGLFTYQSLAEAAARDTGHLTLSSQQYFTEQEDFPLQCGLADWQQQRQALMAINGIKAVQPRIEFSGLISNGDKSAIFIGQGVLASEFTQKGPFLDVKAGQLLSPEERQEQPQVLLGEELARNMKAKPGNWITLLSTTTEGALNAYDFMVQGIVSTGVPEMDKRLVYVSLDFSQALLATDKVSLMSVFAFANQDIEQLKQQVEQQQASLLVTPWWKQAFFYEAVKGLYNRIFGVMGIIMALVVFVSLFNTLSMSVTERTREIGTLSALGTANSEQLIGFVLEAVVLAVIGSLIGLLLSGSVSLFLLFADIQMPPPPGRSVGYPLHITFSLFLAAIVSFGVVCICALASAIAANKGLKKPITEALIYV
ncbi:ABC transporter permease [Agarivorans sp. Toyoura001]|uniref:ABC transporter permease n=1 Tax=Agarivorans sp. Toyoura001 TaxID=2283141 RepID=UPI0010D3A861|nr:FtsX-like permease family protein [Agarivorans sp. Toyoura001]GDY25158.1 ABC transporter permease [Agarivorans sp. Toyoura001]